MVSQYAWDVPTALAIMRAESGCDPSSDNAGLNVDGTNDVGLMQINSIHVASGLISEEARRNPAENIRVAYQLYADRKGWDSNGWNAWSTYLNGDYLKFL